MLRIIFSLIFFSIHFYSFSQIKKTYYKIYYNEFWEITSKDFASFYRIAQYKNRIFDGPIKDYWITGELQMSGEYSNWVAVGNCTWYYKNGKMMAMGEYSTGDLNLQTAWDSLGNVVVQDGNGYFSWPHFHNGVISSKGAYKNGNHSGIWTYYNVNGVKIEEYDHDAGKMLNAWNEAGDNFIVKKGNGTYIRYYKNGRIKTKGKYKEGKKDGEWIEYFENGDFDNKGTYKDGLQDGTWTYFYEKNRRRKVINYSKDTADGEVTWYHANGRISTKGAYKMGKDSGKWIYYDEDGNVTSEYDYDK